MVPGDRLLPLPALEEKVGFKHAKIYRLIRAAEFPPGRMIFGKRLWRESEIDAWIERAWQAAAPDQEEPVAKPDAPPPAAPPIDPPPTAASPYWTSDYLCERFGISRRTLSRWT
ncbi:MAG: helix-turn-helix domain-containing protein, partial [Halorhodospira sp.]